ncbi:hypothetical protein ONZ45_g12917 [Pleurotus djamor]|nr:hypothetical protein ONZ45_g12917 [Pleurotus djamor]
MSDYDSGAGVDDALNCGSGGGDDAHFGLRIGSIFIIWFGGTAGALFPVLARRSSWLRVPKSVFEFAKYFGSGVIIATAFIHLLSPGLDALGSECLAEHWGDYPYALALCLLSIFVIFIVELIAFRWGTAKLAKLGITHGAFYTHMDMVLILTQAMDLKVKLQKQKKLEGREDVESATSSTAYSHDAMAQVIGIAILEFGIVLHSVLIGLTLAVDEDFIVLFIVLIFHQTFEGLGVGSRLAFMDLPKKYNYIPIVAALFYGVTTPVGIAAGLGVRTTYNPDSTTASIVSGTMDSLSAGILIYTGLVELLAHEFLFNKEMMNASNGKLAYALGSMLLGCGIMALLGRWA